MNEVMNQICVLLNQKLHADVNHAHATIIKRPYNLSTIEVSIIGKPLVCFDDEGTITSWLHNRSGHEDLINKIISSYAEVAQAFFARSSVAAFENAEEIEEEGMEM